MSKATEEEPEELPTDSTRVDLEFDPTSEHISGIARHGYTPFDMPYMTQVHENLWQGGCHGMLTLPTWVENVLSLYVWDEYVIDHELKNYERVVMHDSEEGIPHRNAIIELAETVNEWCKDGPTLVHCQAGLNRSGLICGTALVLRGWDPRKAVQHLRDQRSPAVLCNKKFAEFVLNMRP